MPGTITTEIYHDCVKPEIAYTERTVETGHWLWKRQHTIKNYTSESFTFTCECGSIWKYHSGYDGALGFWFCQHRTCTIKKVKV